MSTRIIEELELAHWICGDSRNIRIEYADGQISELSSLKHDQKFTPQ